MVNVFASHMRRLNSINKILNLQMRDNLVLYISSLKTIVKNINLTNYVYLVFILIDIMDNSNFIQEQERFAK